MATHAAHLASCVTLPMIADADTGDGNVLNVVRTVREYERAGVAAAVTAIERALARLRDGDAAGHEGPVLGPMDLFRRVGFDWCSIVAQAVAVTPAVATGGERRGSKTVLLRRRAWRTRPTSSMVATKAAALTGPTLGTVRSRWTRASCIVVVLPPPPPPLPPPPIRAVTAGP